MSAVSGRALATGDPRLSIGTMEAAEGAAGPARPGREAERALERIREAVGLPSRVSPDVVVQAVRVLHAAWMADGARLAASGGSLA